MQWFERSHINSWKNLKILQIIQKQKSCWQFYVQFDIGNSWWKLEDKYRNSNYIILISFFYPIVFFMLFIIFLIKYINHQLYCIVRLLFFIRSTYRDFQDSNKENESKFQHLYYMALNQVPVSVAFLSLSMRLITHLLKRLHNHLTKNGLVFKLLLLCIQWQTLPIIVNTVFP